MSNQEKAIEAIVEKMTVMEKIILECGEMAEKAMKEFDLEDFEKDFCLGLMLAASQRKKINGQ